MRANLTSLGLLILASFFFVGCGAGSSKKFSPEALQTNRLDWNMKTLVTAYQNNGSTDSKWDDPATRALTEFARSRSGTMDLYEPVGEIIATNCQAAMDSGCDDPMVHYLFIKYCMSQTNTPKAFLDAMENVEGKMQASSYPSIRKFYASFRAFQQFMYTYGYGSNIDYTAGYQLFNDAMSDLVAVINDKTTPPGEIYDAANEMIYQFPGNITTFQNYWQQIETPLFANWSDKAISWLLKGKAYNIMGAIERGNGYANTVTKEGRDGLARDSAEAEKALNRAWELDPTDGRIAVTMLWVETQRGEGRDQMEMWFNRAMKDDPNDYDACAAKLNYIQPKWYGSIDDMVEFGRQCVTNTSWGGTVPLVLVDAHYDIANMYTNETDQMNYWRQPDVWADISSAYERYFQDNSDDGRMAYYARYAYYAEQWKKLDELLPKVKPEYYYLFGGADKFNQIVQSTKSNVSQQ